MAKEWWELEPAKWMNGWDKKMVSLPNINIMSFHIWIVVLRQKYEIFLKDRVLTQRILTVSGLRLLSRSIIEKHSLTMAFLD